ncbi:MAG: hypothetical protein KAY37_14285 [Phycisphaerae bacterium]|nr:hypothetical protein [Phycisphaerae bacterium]
MLVLFWAGAPARAQYPVEQRVNTGLQQPGRLLDSNPGRYGTGLNYTRPVSPLVGGNPYASGIVGRGLSLRSYSPISDPTTFRAPLGSADLYTFRRDSVSLFDVSRPLGTGPFAQPYYDPATTVVTSGFLRGLTVPSRSARSSSSSGLRLDLRIPLADTQRGLYTQIVSPAPAPTPPTASSIFGVPTLETPSPPRLALPLVTDQQPPWSGEIKTQTELPEIERDNLGRRIPWSAELSPVPTEPLATPLDVLLQGDSSSRLGLIEPVTESPPWAGGWQGDEFRPGLILPEVGEEVTEVAGEPSDLLETRIVDPSVLPGFDIFTDMRLALELARDPSAEWFQEMQVAARSEPDLVREAQEQALQDAEQFVQRMMDAPLRTFTGGGSSEFNNQMLKAESLMDIGHFQEAADRYDRAHRLDPYNPLPLLGKGHAYLAMGAYNSAADALIRGLERFPEAARFSIDLKVLMGGGENIDIRRADLMRRLRQRETPEMLFLLGYLEYHTGDRERGLANLEKAAHAPRANMIIARYPALLRGQGIPPLPKFSDERQTEPDTPLPPRAPRVPTDEPDTAPEETLILPPPVK